MFLVGRIEVVGIVVGIVEIVVEVGVFLVHVF